MAKTNYTKVEEALAEGMLKIEVNKLLNAADEVTGKPQGDSKAKVDRIHLQRLKKIDHDLKLLDKQGKNPYVQLKINPQEIKQFLKNASQLSSQEWERIRTIKDQIAVYKAELEKGKAESVNDEIINKEIKKQKSKRFNINEKWIPMR